MAQTDTKQTFTVAEANLLDAQRARGETHKDTVGCVQGLVDLYTAWDKAEPGKGYDAKAAQWRAQMVPGVQQPAHEGNR